MSFVSPGHIENLLEVHHIFPKALLYDHEYDRAEVNAVANFCLLTRETNASIGATPPAEYFAEAEASHPGVLASQWIPADPELWRVERYQDFLAERRRLLADAASRFLAELGHGFEHSLPASRPPSTDHPEATPTPSVPGGITSDEEGAALRALNDWVVERGLPGGALMHELADAESGEPTAILDLAWPSGLQPGYSPPAAVLIDEPRETLEAANAAGFRYFTTIEAFRRYVLEEALADHSADQEPLL